MAAKHSHRKFDSSAAAVNHLVANLGLFNVKLHQYHWHVKGKFFFTLHEKFEEFYNETNEKFDTFAERLLQLGEKPYSTLEEYMEHAVIEESKYDKEISAEDMVANLVDDFQTLRDITAKGIELAGDEGDTVTEDMLIEYKSSIDFHLWTLEAYLGKDVKSASRSR